MTYIRDCGGNVMESYEHEFRDVGIELNHRFEDRAEVGVRGRYWLRL
jgi:hypothetical protein